jgi:tetratricopeptide (TPR) repeat protein
MSEEVDAGRWEAVEEATEVLLEGEHGRALALLRDALAADPQNHYAYFYIGAALFDLRKLEEAKDAYRAAVRIAPDYLGARVGLSQTLRKLGQHEAAVMEADEALRRFPDDGDALHAAGMALAAGGKKRRAREALERFLATGPELEAQLEARSVLAMLDRVEEGQPLELA